MVNTWAKSTSCRYDLTRLWFLTDWKTFLEDSPYPETQMKERFKLRTSLPSLMHREPGRKEFEKHQWVLENYKSFFYIVVRICGSVVRRHLEWIRKVKIFICLGPRESSIRRRRRTLNSARPHIHRDKLK